jgi:alpha-beta hydrolase superfamily lysophospholipase
MTTWAIFAREAGSNRCRQRWLAGAVCLLVGGGQALRPCSAARSTAAAEEPVPAEPGTAEEEKPQAPPDTPKEDEAEELELETSDGITIGVWHYPGNPGGGPGAGISVILLHDYASSHKGVEPLARALQSIGCTVVAPDLRGHGVSRTKRIGDREIKVDAKQLKSVDIEMIAASRGGQIRDQSLHHGDVETTRNWMVAQKLPMDRLYVAGVGLGAALAAAWAADDANWPDNVAGPQGKQVRGVVMISPAPAVRGFSLVKPMEQDALKRTIPILILGGRTEKDADRLFDQFKRHRPLSWFRRPANGEAERADKLEDASKATAFQIVIDAAAEGEKLAAEAAVATSIGRFFDLTKPAAKNKRP